MRATLPLTQAARVVLALLVTALVAVFLWSALGTYGRSQPVKMIPATHFFGLPHIAFCHTDPETGESFAQEFGDPSAFEFFIIHLEHGHTVTVGPCLVVDPDPDPGEYPPSQ